MADSKPAQGRPTLGEAVHQQLQPAEVAILDRLDKVDRLTSLWAPVTVLAAVFLVYLIIVEFSVCTYTWLQMPMKIVGVLCFFWWAALVVGRVAMSSYFKARKSRGQALEVIESTEKLADKNRNALKDKQWDVLVSDTVRVMKSLGDSKAKTIDETAELLQKSADRELAQFQGNSTVAFAMGFGKALAVALLVRAILLDPFKIPSGSMINTLEIGDQIFVNKFIYGVRLPFTNYVPFQIVRAPKRGDVIVFNNPVQPDRDFIKRIVGVGGDTIRFDGRSIIVNGEELKTEVENDDFTVWNQPYTQFNSLVDWVKYWFENDWSAEQVSLRREVIDGVPHSILNSDQHFAHFSETVKVPEGQVFVMGDNRDNSLDSRFGLGAPGRGVEFVPRAHIKGKATVIWLSLGHGGLLSGIFGGTGIRTDRFFKPVTMCGTEEKR